jgi:phage-related minor tail protein
VPYYIAAPESFTAFQHGGLVTKPTMGLVGEAGPEAIVPLGALGGGGGTTVNIYNQAPGTETTTTRRQGPNGRAIYDIVVKSVQQMIGNGQMDSMMAPYATRRVPTQR